MGVPLLPSLASIRRATILWSETEKPRSTTSSFARVWVPFLKECGICPLPAFSFYPLSFQNHHSFTAVDPCLGPLVLSVCLEEEENRLRVILRSSYSYLWGTEQKQCVRRGAGWKAPLLTSDLGLTGAFTGGIWLYGSWLGGQSF